jgi:acyl carrier protein
MCKTRLQSGALLVETVKMTDDEQEIFDKLSELLQPYNEKQIELKPQTEIAVDLAIDSVSVMDFVMEVEDHFDMDIPLNVLSETHTMKDLISVVQARTNKA